MPPNHPLIKTQTRLHRRQRHHSKLPDEPSNPQRPRPRNHLLTDYHQLTPDLTLTAVRPARTKNTPRVSTGS